MNVASLELCKELYELSGWKGTYFNWAKFGGHLASETPIEDRWHITDVQAVADYPAYDLGYLLRKLEGFDVRLHYSNTWRRWTAWAHNDQHSQFEDTPEDAVAKLCIELIKQGVLKP